jgi:hypothetical protein
MDEFIKVLEEAIDTLQHTYANVPKIQEYTGLQIEISDGEWQHSDHVTWRAWTGRRRIWGLEHHGPVYVLNSKDDSVAYTGRRFCKCSICQSHIDATIKSN